MYSTMCAYLLVLILPTAAMSGDFEKGVAAFEQKDFDSAVTNLTKAIEANPKSPAAYFYRGLAYREKKDFDRAIGDFSECIPLEPAPAHCYYNRGIVHLMKRDFEKAIKDFDEAVRLEPKNATPYLGRAYTYGETRRYEKAEADYMTAIRLDPKQRVGLNNFAWLRASCPDAKFRDGKKAVELAKIACELSEWQGLLELNTLAAAHAENGNFKEAVKWQKIAIKQGYDEKELLDKANQRLKLYENGKPYRQE